MGPTEIGISDQFWEANSQFSPTAFRYESLDEITADAHLIVRGRVVGTQEHEALPVEDPGGELTARPVTFGVITINEVLKGVPNILQPGAVLVTRLGSMGQERSELPREEIVIFLKNYEQLAEESGGNGLFGDASDRFYYTRPNGYQAVLRNINGVVKVIAGPEGWEEALGPYPATLDGQPFDQLLEAIRRSVSSGSLVVSSVNG
ncbi:MAG TPA: hypothetical protein VFP56_09950 [Candidatus Limnocylindrales bacterium]|nr:hypothetical protein [Candidatus Limnocylindrales bacterium]